MYRQMGSSSKAHFLKVLARYSYFFFATFSIFGALIHLHLRFKHKTCHKNSIPSGDRCVGRNLVWQGQNNDDGLQKDLNKEYWRTVISFTPDVFVDTWTPFVFAILSFSQSFVGAKWDLISGSWLRSFIFILIWHLFAVIGYAANWGVFMGLWGILQLGLLYLILAIIGDPDEPSTLSVDIRYLMYRYLGIGNPPTPRGSMDEERQGGDSAGGSGALRKSSGLSYQAIDDPANTGPSNPYAAPRHSVDDDGAVPTQGNGDGIEVNES